MTGWWMVAARLEQPDATPSDTTYQALSTTTGVGIALSEAFTSAAVAATVQNAFEIVYLGPLPIPAAELPHGRTSGYDVEASEQSSVTEDSDLLQGATVIAPCLACSLNERGSASRQPFAR